MMKRLELVLLLGVTAGCRDPRTIVLVSIPIRIILQSVMILMVRGLFDWRGGNGREVRSGLGSFGGLIPLTLLFRVALQSKLDWVLLCISSLVLRRVKASMGHSVLD